jgi:hypothetical protein
MIAARVTALRHVHRHILERMHGEIGAVLVHRLLELLDEQPLPPMSASG